MYVLPRGGLFLTLGLLIAALMPAPAVGAAQPVPAQAAMVEGSRTDFQTWGFAAQVPVGGTLTWTNLGTQPHTVTAADGSFDSGAVAPGWEAALEFRSPGVFAYACTLHPSMKGYVVVSPDSVNAGPKMAIVEGNPSDETTWGYAVSVQVGQSVTWTNLGGQAHAVTAADGSYDSGLVNHGSDLTLEFDKPGVFAYLCGPHPWMRGNVAVNPLAAEDPVATP